MSKQAEDLEGTPNRLLVAVFLVMGTIGMAVMVGSLIFAFLIPNPNTGETGLESLTHPQYLRTTPEPSPTATDDFGIPPVTMKTYDYDFKNKSELKDFKKSGPGTLSLSKGRLMLKTTPGRTITVRRTFNLMQPATVSMTAAASSEYPYDRGNVSIDGLPVIGNLSGYQSMSYSQHLTGGTHTIDFTYTKDWEVAVGEDAFFITKLRIPSAGTGGWA